MSLEHLSSTNLAVAVSTGAAGYAIYRYAQHVRQSAALEVTGNDASFREKEEEGDEGSKSLILTVMKHHPKNMTSKQIRDAIQFIRDKVKGKPMNDRLMAVCDPLWAKCSHELSVKE